MVAKPKATAMGMLNNKPASIITNIKIAIK